MCHQNDLVAFVCLLARQTKYMWRFLSLFILFIFNWTALDGTTLEWFRFRIEYSVAEAQICVCVRCMVSRMRNVSEFNLFNILNNAQVFPAVRSPSIPLFLFFYPLHITS